ncbi:MarR family winged helix-turn-helix transcriptional regulator [Aureimonas ureilytica]|uniref:MarR family winged helix-turn-helix transcriptional regulator n=1 Tax=Aureimonas ureilytica TaxID=401562 RepID=UPI0003640E92|nr:MarR family winged helix-turn-helix transcriptional regulator [Aureimonas ureilytica]
MRSPAPPNFVSDRTSDGNDLVQPLIAISKATRQLVAIRLAEIGVVAGQDQLLDALDRTDPRSVCAVAQDLSVRPSTVSKMLDILERRGWCFRQADEADMRRTCVRLTEEGERMRSEVHRIWADVNGDLGRTLPQPDLHTLTAALWDIERLVSGRLSRLR